MSEENPTDEEYKSAMAREVALWRETMASDAPSEWASDKDPDRFVCSDPNCTNHTRVPDLRYGRALTDTEYRILMARIRIENEKRRRVVEWVTPHFQQLIGMNRSSDRPGTTR